MAGGSRGRVPGDWLGGHPVRATTAAVVAEVELLSAAGGVVGPDAVPGAGAVGETGVIDHHIELARGAKLEARGDADLGPRALEILVNLDLLCCFPMIGVTMILSIMVPGC